MHYASTYDVIIGGGRQTQPPTEKEAGFMKKEFTLDYWMDDGWYVGRLREAPDVFSQGKTFEELQLNIKDAFDLMRQESPAMPVENFSSAELSIEVS